MAAQTSNLTGLKGILYKVRGLKKLCNNTLGAFNVDESFKNKKVIITGANGFIGSHIVKRIIEHSSDLSVLVRETSDLWRLEEYKKHINIIHVDLRDGTQVSKCMCQIKPDYVFHMAAYGVDSRQMDYITASETNIIGTINLLKGVSKVGCEKVINTGTSMQYGNKAGPITEDESYVPTNIYGSTKAASVIVAHQIARENRIDIATIIPFGVFGEKEGSHKFIPHVILSALNNRDIDLSPCEQFRDYCYVENIIDGFVMVALNNNIKDEIFNIGSGKVYLLKHYVEIMLKKMRIDKRVMYGAVEYRKNDLWNPLPDIGKISGMLGWKPGISLEEGLDRTIEWYKENVGKYNVKGR